MNKHEILKDAQVILDKRGQVYSEAYEIIGEITRAITVLTEIDVDKYPNINAMITMMMIKLVRFIQNLDGNHEVVHDSICDLINYAAIVGELALNGDKASKKPPYPNSPKETLIVDYDQTLTNSDNQISDFEITAHKCDPQKYKEDFEKTYSKELPSLNYERIEKIKQIAKNSNRCIYVLTSRSELWRPAILKQLKEVFNNYHLAISCRDVGDLRSTETFKAEKVKTLMKLGNVKGFIDDETNNLIEITKLFSGRVIHLEVL